MLQPEAPPSKPPPHEPARSEPPTANLVASRYRLIRELGQGGMATVWEAIDTSTGATIALKRMRAPTDPQTGAGLMRLFEREYFTLAQLAHPRVVTVYDYGVDEQGPYYTMELLDGGDLHALKDIDWRRACKAIVDACSAVALVHSRRLVHRDLSPRNIRCTTDGTAKVIDFGALAPMGPVEELVGTPALCAPETLGMLPLDGRSDIYSLGATLYYTLTGRHAYPARDFRQLRALHGTVIQRPSRLNPAVPEALDDLVMQMLHADPAMRPPTAGEVMERLSGLAEIPIAEELVVPQAYLSTPSLVGRERSLARIGKKVSRTARGRGESLVIKGDAGIGRSRLLDTSILDAKLQGVLTLRAGPSPVGATDYGAVRTLGLQLLDAGGEAAQAAASSNASILAHVFPEVLDAYPGVELSRFVDPSDLGPRLQAALQTWFVAASQDRALLVAVDDLDQVDEPSAAFVALLAHEVRRHPILLLTTVDAARSADPSPTVQLLLQRSTVGSIGPLSPEDTLALLRSVFGAVPHIELVAHRIHEAAAGNPRDTMQLAQHLVDRGLARYQGGAWSLPEAIDTSDLPADMAEALRVRVGALSREARLLASAMALRPDRGLTFEQCVRLVDEPDPRGLIRSLEELVRAGVAQATAGQYALAQPGWVPPIRASLSADQAQALHRKLADCFDAEADGFVVAQHLLLAGEQDRGLSVLVSFSEASEKLTNGNADAYYALMRALPPDWCATFTSAIELAERLGRPKREVHLMRSRLAGVLATRGIDHPATIRALLSQLCHDCGLDLYDELGDSIPPEERLPRALEQAHKRFAELPADEKVFSPMEAMRPLTRAVVACIPPALYTNDYTKWERMPSLAPLAPLSPALAIIEQMRVGVGYRVSGRMEKTRAMYVAMLDRLSQPDQAGLESTYHRHLYYPFLRMVGSIDACSGLDSALDWADDLEEDPFYEASAHMVRMLYHLWQGDAEKADACRDQVDRVGIQNAPPQMYDVHLTFELAAYAATDDLTRIKHALARVEDMAKRLPGWVPIAHFARAAYQRIRGDRDAALEEITEAMRVLEPGRSQVWPDAAREHLEVLNALGCHAEACDLGEAYLASAKQLEMEHAARMLMMPLAVAHAHLGGGERASELCESCVAGLDAIGATGVVLGLAYYAWAQVDAALGNEEAFAAHAQRCGKALGNGTSRNLRRKLDRLRHRAEAPRNTFRHEDGRITMTENLDRVTSLLAEAGTRTERARQALGLLLEECEVESGFLYALDETGFELVASVDADERSDDVDVKVGEYLSTCMSVGSTTTGSETAGATQTEWRGPDGRRYHAILLEHATPAGFAITGVAVLAPEMGQHYSSPMVLASALSRCIAESGDVVPRIVE